MGNQLYVGNLDYQTTSEDLSALFTGEGEVWRAQIIFDRDTQQSKGFAFVEMANAAEALRAISLYNGYVLNDRALLVNEARPRDATSGVYGSNCGSTYTSRPKFREIRHKARGGRKARSY